LWDYLASEAGLMSILLESEIDPKTINGRMCSGHLAEIWFSTPAALKKALTIKHRSEWWTARLDETSFSGSAKLGDLL
jgi:hypothetical protein